MKNKKMKVLFSILTILACLSFNACGSDNEIMTAKEFKTTMENKGLVVHDQTETASSNSYQYIYVAIDENKYSFEYYYMKNESSATTVYDYAVNGLKNKYESDEDVIFEDGSKGARKDFSVQAEDYYVRTIQNDNTVLYITSYIDYEEECISLLEELDY